MTRIVKLGGRVQESPTLAPALRDAWLQARAGEAPAIVVVHGGGDAITALQQRFGVAAQFNGGRRVTSDADIPLLRMALSGAANKLLVSALVAEGVPAVGVSGEDAGMLRARAIDRATLGAVGRPSIVDTALLDHLLHGGFCPVIAPMAMSDEADDPTGALNVNGDEAAAAIAVAMNASELLFVADVDGVLVDGKPIPSLSAASAHDLMARGVIAGGMAVKVRAALQASARGIANVRIGGVSAITSGFSTSFAFGTAA